MNTKVDVLAEQNRQLRETVRTLAGDLVKRDAAFRGACCTGPDRKKLMCEQAVVMMQARVRPLDRVRDVGGSLRLCGRPAMMHLNGMIHLLALGRFKHMANLGEGLERARGRVEDIQDEAGDEGLGALIPERVGGEEASPRDELCQRRCVVDGVVAC